MMLPPVVMLQHRPSYSVVPVPCLAQLVALVAPPQWPQPPPTHQASTWPPHVVGGGGTTTIEPVPPPNHVPCHTHHRRISCHVTRMMQAQEPILPPAPQHRLHNAPPPRRPRGATASTTLREIEPAFHHHAPPTASAATPATWRRTVNHAPRHCSGSTMPLSFGCLLFAAFARRGLLTNPHHQQPFCLRPMPMPPLPHYVCCSPPPSSLCD